MNRYTPLQRPVSWDPLQVTCCDFFDEASDGTATLAIHSDLKACRPVGEIFVDRDSERRIRSRIDLSPLGRFVATFDEWSAITFAEGDQRAAWCEFPSFERLARRWMDVRVGGRLLQARVERVPMASRIPALRDPANPDGGTVYFGLNGAGVPFWPVLYWPFLFTSLRRRVRPTGLYDPRFPIGLLRAKQPDTDLVLRGLILCLGMLTAELGMRKTWCGSPGG